MIIKLDDLKSMTFMVALKVSQVKNGIKELNLSHGFCELSIVV